MRIAALATISCSLLLSFANAQYTLSLEKTFNENPFKNVAFFAAFGGSSHYNWVLNIIDELGSRGHNTTFITTDNDARFGQPYSYVKTVSIGPSIKIPGGAVTGAENILTKYPASYFSSLLLAINQNLERDFIFLKDYFIENEIDVAICDHSVNTCVEVSKMLNIPFIVTGTLDLSKDSATPYIDSQFNSLYDTTTEYQSFLERFKNAFLNPIRDVYYMLPFAREIRDRKLALGIPATTMRDITSDWKDALKLVNAVNGFVAPRPIGPLVEYVGPIMPKQYTPLPEDLKKYLDNHHRIAYVAFGQKATPSEDEIKLILTALLENIENGSLDGVVWATVNAAGLFPDTITTTAGITYNVQDFFGGIHPDVHIVKWAPQTAVLAHPSTTVFVSHGGLGSWYESMYTGTRMIMFPFFSDQPANSLIIERSKLGGILKYDFTPEQAKALVKKIVDDETGEIRRNVKRFQALIQIHSEHGVIRAADLVEEVAYTHVNGRLPHRESADRRMSYVKANNIDLYIALIVLVGSCIRVIWLIIKTAFLTSGGFSPKLKQQ